jgi:hypothetical protein
MRILTAALLVACVPAIAEQSSVTLDGKAIAVSWTPVAKGKPAVWKIADSFKADADLVFKGVMVPKGEYSLWVLPAADKWQLIISKQTGARPYDAKMDAGRVNMTLTKPSAAVGASRVTLTKAAALAAKLEIASEGTVATTQFRLDRVGSNSEW